MNISKPLKYIYALKNRILHKDKPTETPTEMIGSLSQNFVLAISDQFSQNNQQGTIVEQQRTKFGQYLFSFQQKSTIKIVKQNIILSFPFNYQKLEGKYHLSEDQFRKFIVQFRSILSNDQSDQEVYDKYSQSIQPMQACSLSRNSVDVKVRGRPRGTKNKKKDSFEKSSDSEFCEQSKKNQEKRGRGRPKGAKNVKKHYFNSQDLIHEYSLYHLFSSVLEIKSIEEINTILNKIKDRDEKIGQTKKQEFEGQQIIKRSRGRPKGVKNKPKINNQESQSQQTYQAQNLPKRKNNKTSNFGKCCSRCAELIAKKQYYEGKNIPVQQLKNIFQDFGPQDKTNMILETIKSGNEQSLKKILTLKNVKQNNFIINWDTNSKLQQSSYTIKTKKQFISKNKREGIHALIQDCYRSYEVVWWKIIGIERILMKIPNSKNSVEIYQILTDDENDNQFVLEINMNIPTLIRNGNELLSTYLIEKILKSEQNSSLYGYSKDHLECLNKKRSELAFKKSIMLKQNFTSNFCSPIHCATINSNTDLLSYILKNISSFNVGDSLNRKPVHYAAVLDNTKALEILVKHGACLKDIDKKKMTPLMLAAQAGKYKCLKYILDKVRDVHVINFRGEEGLSALHYAVINRHYDCAVLMLDDQLVEGGLETKEGMNVFHLAIGNGQKDLVKWLIEQQYTPEPDNYRRTPLMISIRNHQNELFFYLFSTFPKYYKRDHSHNTLLHYAAAYGNLQILKYLLELNLPQTMNRKCFYPFEIAILKGHIECAKILQNWNLLFSQHLLNRIVRNARGTAQFREIFDYLLQCRRYDLNYRNTMAGGLTCLHFVCGIGQKSYGEMRRKESSIVEKDQFKNMQKYLISSLLSYGAFPDIETDKGHKPLHFCIENENLTGIKLLLTQIPFQIFPATKSNHFAYYLTNIAIQGYKDMQFVRQKLEKVDEKILKIQLKKTDVNGFQFLVYLVKKYTQTVHHNFWMNYLEYKKNIISENGLKNNKKAEKQAIYLALKDYIVYEESFVKMVNFLVERGSDPRFIVLEPKMDDQQENYKKWGIQHFLMKFPSLNLLKTFGKWIDINFNLQNSEGRAPLHLFCLWNKEGCLFNNYQLKGEQLPIVEISLNENYDGKKCLQFLLQNGLTCNILDINRSTPLLYAALKSQLGFIKLLRSFGCVINNSNSMNEVPLIEIIKSKDKYNIDQIQSILADEDLNPDFKDLNDRNVLHHLVSRAKNFDNAPELCKRLIQYGANINGKDKYGRSPIFYCFIKIEEQEESQENYNDKVEILQILLTIEGLQLDVVDIYQRTPLHYACENKFFYTIVYLLQKNINHDMIDAEGNTPLAICLKHKNLNQAAMIIKKGVKYGNVVEDHQTYPYFSYAIQKLSAGICFILIDNGYPLNKALEEAPNEPFKKLLKKRYRK